MQHYPVQPYSIALIYIYIQYDSDSAMQTLRLLLNRRKVHSHAAARGPERHRAASKFGAQIWESRQCRYIRYTQDIEKDPGFQDEYRKQHAERWRFTAEHWL